MSASTEKDAEKGQEQVRAPSQTPPPYSNGQDEHHTKRRLKARHIQMIAIGGTIGTGLFVGSGEALELAGPLGLLLGYLIMGTIVFTVMIALGEMTSLYPVAGAFNEYASRFIDPALGFAQGYNYWYAYATALPTEISAGAVVISYWDATTNPGAWITVMLAVALFINFCGVRWYGEMEFWFSFIKVITIVGLIILGIIIDLGGGPVHDRIGFRYWRDPGALVQFDGIDGAKGRFLAFWATFINAAYSYEGTEIIALAAGETANPGRNMPRAIRQVFWRILLFYVCGVIIIGMLVPYNNSRLLSASNTASASPFVIAINNAGIKVLPSIINAVILVAAFSAANSDLYASSRTLYGLACSGQAPRLFRYCTKGGLPIWAVAISGCFGFLGYMNVKVNSGQVFTWLVDLGSITGLLTWLIILVTFIRFLAGVKHQGLDRNTFPYKAPWQPYASYYGAFWMTLIIIFNGWSVFLKGNWNTQNFITAYISIPIFIFFYVFWKLYARTKYVSLDEMDLITGRRGIYERDEDESNSEEPKTFIQRAWEAIM